MEGLISYSDLKNGTINLYDLFIMNELLDYKKAMYEKAQRDLKVKRAMKK